VSTQLDTIRTERDDDGVVTLTLDDQTQSANTMRAQFVDDLEQVVQQLEDDRKGMTGL